MIIRPLHLVGALALSVFAASGASATAPRPVAAKARLHRCGDTTCLLVTGRRAAPDAAVSLAGHDVKVEGGTRWRTELALDTVRAWSVPSARTIAVRVAGVGETAAVLPIGLLGHQTELAFLEVRAH